MSAYLTDFKKRMNSIVIPYKLAQYCGRNEKAYRKNLVSDELFFVLIHYVLLYIEECNVKRKFCTKDLVSEELNTICGDLGISIGSYELASDIINHCCENDGNRLLFDAKNETMQPFEIHLIEGKYELREGRYVTGYELTPQCLDYIYATKEIAELGRVSIEQIKLEKAIKAGNFVEARHNVDSLILAIETQKKAFQMKERMVFTNILTLEVSEVMQDITSALKMIDSQRNDSLDIKKLLEAQGKTPEQGMDGKRMDAAFHDIYYVKDRLNLILGLQMNLISVLQEFLAKFKEELVSADFITESASIDIMEDIIRPLEGDLLGKVNPFHVLLPLFHLTKQRRFNINAIFLEQTMIKDKEDEDVEIDNINTKELVYDNTEQILERNEQYEELFLTILRAVDEEERVHLSDLVNQYPVFGDNLAATKVVLTTLLYEREIVFDNLNSFRSSGDMEVFFPEILHTKSGLSLANKKLVIETTQDEEVSIEEATSNCHITSIIKVPNMMFHVENVEEN